VLHAVAVVGRRLFLAVLLELAKLLLKAGAVLDGGTAPVARGLAAASARG
jgi:hypothetical protein